VAKGRSCCGNLKFEKFLISIIICPLERTLRIEIGFLKKNGNMGLWLSSNNDSFLSLSELSSQKSLLQIVPFTNFIFKKIYYVSNIRLIWEVPKKEALRIGFDIDDNNNFWCFLRGWNKRSWES